MNDSVAHVVPDTNQALHYKRLDEIDWCLVTKAKMVVVHIPPVYLRELEVQKVQNRSSRLRERASATVRWLSQLADQPDPLMIRPDVELRFIDHEPTLDFSANKLSQQIGDDVLIASALELADTVSEPVHIASGDAGVKVKVRSRKPSLQYLHIPEEARLPAEQDPDQKRLREAETELARLKGRSPKLSVRMKGGAARTRIALNMPTGSVPTLDEIKAKHPLQPEKLPSQNDDWRLAAMRPLLKSNERYNANLREYYKRYRTYERQHADYRAMISRSFDAEFEVQNVGRAPATNIDVVIRFPPEVRVLRRRDFPKPPEEPEAPKPGAASLLFEPYKPKFTSFFPLSPDSNQDGKPFVRADTNTVEYTVANLKHEFTHELRGVIIIFEPGGEPKSFSAEFSAHCDETDAVRGKLNFVIADSGPAEEGEN